MWGRFARYPAQVNGSSQALEQPILEEFHLAPGMGALVVITLEMEDAMDEMARQFAGPVDAIMAGLKQRLRGAEEDFAVEVEAGILGKVIESDHVGGAFVMEPTAVEVRHGGERKQVDAEGEGGESEFGLEEVLGGVNEGLFLNAAGALAVGDDDFVHFGALPRCSS
jgi:hypothetical protein